MPFSKAELFWSAWGRYEVLTLTMENNLLVLSVEEDLAPLPDPEWNPDPWQFSRLYFEADGYVAVQSEPIDYVETENGHGLPSPVGIEFRNIPDVVLRSGETLEIELTLRKPQERYLRFVDDEQMPVPGIGVRSYVFFSNSNHCAVPMGEKFLDENVSDRDGRVSIPDGEFEYLFELYGHREHSIRPPYHRVGFNEDGYDGGPWELIAHLSDQETVIELHRLRKQPLEMVVTRNGVPAANETLCGWHVACTCWCGDYPIAETDEDGMISLEEFYPEEWIWIAFTAPGKLLWEAHPHEQWGNEVIHVELNEQDD